MVNDTSLLPIMTMCPMSKVAPVLRPVGEKCNLKCMYCYYNNSDQKYNKHTIMSTEILESFIKQYLSIYDGKIEFMWHGGEPLLAGKEFYFKALEFQEKYKTSSHKIENNIQTNGTLIDKEWASFFRENNFYVGISLDGIEECHNMYRKNTNGEGTYANVIKAIDTLREFNLEPGILQTVTKSSLPYTRQNFLFFVDSLGIKKWGVNIYNDINNTNPLLHNEVITNEDYFQLYKDIYLLCKNRDDIELEIREIQTAVYAVLGRFTGMCSSSGICSSFISVDSNGDIYPSCDKDIAKRMGLLLGNIKTRNLIDILNSSSRIAFGEKINSLPTKCKNCKWYSGCYNGCSFQRSNNVFAYCEGRKKLYSFIKEEISNNI